jgi:O-antigen ligase
MLGNKDRKNSACPDLNLRYLHSWMFVSLGRDKVLFWLCALMLVSSLLLGGGTRDGFLSDAIVQLIAIPLLLVTLWRMIDSLSAKQVRWALALCLAIILVPLIQLIPLPPRIWTALPNRALSLAAFELLEREATWMPISVSPPATWLSVLSLLPALAIFLSTILLGHRERRLLSLVALAVGVVSLFVGLMQLAQGPSSPLRFFENTNITEAVGFFANRNHFAALLNTLTLFAAAWAVDAAMTIGSQKNGKGYESAATVAVIAGFTVLVALVAAQAMARSRAGLGLTIVALFGAFALPFSDRRGASGVTPTRLLLGASALAVMFAVQFALYRIAERFAVDPLADERIPFARNTIEAAKAYMPFGSGMGTFVPVYGLFERPEDALAGRYANRAHNDVVELWLEAGVVGVSMTAMFAIWLLLRAVKIWRRSAYGTREIDHYLARAATLVVALLVAHSFVDYPLRTAALMSIMAFACAMLVEPLTGIEREAEVELGKEAQARQLAVEWPAAAGPVPTPTRAAGGRWGEDVVWPEEWRGPSNRRSPSPARPVRD